MAHRVVYRLTLSSNNVIPLVCSRFFHLSLNNSTTHSYAAKVFQLPTDRFQEFLHNNPMRDIRKKSGAVVRFKELQSIDIDEERSCDLLIVGNRNQIEKAFGYLSEYLDGRKMSEDKSGKHEDKGLIWNGYKRNFKGQYPPVKPRKKCIRCQGKKIAGNPCPLCQMVLSSNYEVHFTDTEILNQFICPHTWNILDPSVTGICRIQHNKVVRAINSARLHGYIPFALPLPTDKPVKHKHAGIPTDRTIKVKMH